jgi:hypothetical protein
MAETLAPAPPPRPFPSVLIALPIAGVALGQRFVLPGTSIADLTLAAATVISLGYLAREVRAVGWPRLPRWTRWVAALWAWGAAGGLVHILSESNPFSPAEFAKSLAKFSFYAVAVVVLALVLRHVPRSTPPQIALTAFAVAGAVAVAVYVAMFLRVPLPYQAMWGHGPEAAYFSDFWWFGGAHEARRVFLRAQGLTSEPSRLGYLQSMALAYVLLKPSPRIHFGLRMAVILLSLLLTFSLTAYLFLAPILALVAYDRLRSGQLGMRRRALVVAAGLLLLLAPAAPTVYSTIVVRAMRSVSGAGDLSSFLRLQGNWKMTYYLLETNPLVGVGLGNYDIVAWDLRAFIFEGHLIEKETQGWNVFAYVLATMGAPGLLLLVALLVSAFRGRGRLVVPFFLGMFADGTFLGAAYWVFLALYTADDET